MLATQAEPTVITDSSKHRAAFFRQSGWMMIANMISGCLMYSVHKVAKQIGPQEYSVFTTLLQVVTLMGIPAVGVQTIFAQQAAASLHEGHERELAGVCRGLLKFIFIVWLIMTAIL